MATAKTKRFGVYLSEDGLSALNSKGRFLFCNYLLTYGDDFHDANI